MRPPRQHPRPSAPAVCLPTFAQNAHKPLSTFALPAADAVEQYQFRAQDGDVKEGEEELIIRINTGHDEDIRKITAHLKETSTLERSLSMSGEAGSPKAGADSSMNDLNTSLNEIGSEFSEQLGGLTAEVEMLTEQTAVWKLRAEQAEQRIGGNAQETKAKVETARSTNESMKLEIEAMEKQLELHRTTQLQAKHRVIKLEKEVVEAEQAIKVIEVKTKEAWRQGSGRSAAARLKKANRDMEELAKLKDKTAAIRTGSFKEEPEGGALAAVEKAKPEPTGPAAAAVQAPTLSPAPISSGSEPDPEPEQAPPPSVPEPEPEPEPGAVTPWEPHPPPAAKALSKNVGLDFDAPAGLGASSTLGGISRWEDPDAQQEPTPPSSRGKPTSRGSSSNSSRGSSRGKNGRLPRFKQGSLLGGAGLSADSNGSTPKSGSFGTGKGKKEMKVDLGGLAARLSGLAATGSAEDGTLGTVASGLDASLGSASSLGSGGLGSGGGFSLAGGPGGGISLAGGPSIGRMNSMDGRNAKAKEAAAFTAGPSFRDRVLAKKKKKTGGAGGLGGVGGPRDAGGGGEKGSWSIIAKLESGSFSDRSGGGQGGRLERSMSNGSGTGSLSGSFSAREARGPSKTSSLNAGRLGAS